MTDTYWRFKRAHWALEDLETLMHPNSGGVWRSALARPGWHTACLLRSHTSAPQSLGPASLLPSERWISSSDRVALTVPKHHALAQRHRLHNQHRPDSHTQGPGYVLFSFKTSTMCIGAREDVGYWFALKPLEGSVSHSWCVCYFQCHVTTTGEWHLKKIYIYTQKMNVKLLKWEKHGHINLTRLHIMLHVSERRHSNSTLLQFQSTDT